MPYQFVDKKLSHQILQQARAQQDDEDTLEAEENLDDMSSAMAGASFAATRLRMASDSEDENDGDEIVLSGRPEDGSTFYDSLVRSVFPLPPFALREFCFKSFAFCSMVALLSFLFHPRSPSSC